MSREECREEWRRYLFLTSDFDSDTDALWPFDTTTLLSVEIPENWSVGHALQHFREELAADIISDESPFDRPQPVVIFSNRTFIFTGNFAFGQRRACQQAVSARGGLAPNHKTVSRHTDYLVIGTKGSTAWKKGAYGNKIESAVLARREHGVPAIISEEHWVAALAPA